MIYLPQFDGQLYGLARIRARQPEAIRKAKERFRIHGDPVDGLEELLGSIFPVGWCPICNSSESESAGGCDCQRWEAASDEALRNFETSLGQ